MHSLFKYGLAICLLATLMIYGCDSTRMMTSPSKAKWEDLLDPKMTKWEKFIGVPHTTVRDLDGYEKSSDVHVGTPLGLGNDPKNVFTMIKENGENVLRASGEIYGGLTSKLDYENYHLQLQYRWAEKKWEPRLNKKRDAGLLYHCTGDHGAFWNVWMRCLEFQIQETDTGDFFALAGANAMGISHPTEDQLNYVHDTNGEWLGIGEKYGNWACSKSAIHELPNGEWNSIDLYVVGDQAIHLVNGNLVNGIKDAHLFEDGNRVPLTKGKLQLQSEGAEIYYKRVRIQTIKEFPSELKIAAAL